MEANTSKMIMLTGSNYSSWKSRMEDLLYVKNYYMPVFSTEKPEDKTEEQWTIFHRQVCGFIRQWVEDNVLNHVSGINHARTLWSKLEELYASNTGSNKMYVMNQLLGLKYKDGSSMADHINNFQGHINQLSSMGLKLEDELLGLWLFGSLPHTWDTFRTSVSNSAPKGMITYDMAKASCMNEEVRRKSIDSNSSSKSDILVTESRGRNYNRGPKSRYGNGRSKSRGKFTDVECHHCGKKGQIKPFCRLLKKENKQRYKEKGKDKKSDESSDTERAATTTEDFLIVYDYDVVNLL
ncbi:retrovirus-related Pol polyprotein from transposon TNT 1-94 [Curcuma longa]|uniref:retrovirus-related Pol polyprotein from transposon TNT 1-94 n=1 Tax=Curcuma longa TaxID=136217 RepID=UPI003D9E552F